MEWLRILECPIQTFFLTYVIWCWSLDPHQATYYSNTRVQLRKVTELGPHALIEIVKACIYTL